MKCEKCKDVGFIEYEAGLLVEFCDCEAGKKAEAKQWEILGYPETPPGPIMNERFQSGVNYAEGINNAEEDIARLKQEAHGLGIDFVEVKNDGDNRAEPDNQPSGSGDTGKPAKPKKPKAKRKARKRAG